MNRWFHINRINDQGEQVASEVQQVESAGNDPDGLTQFRKGSNEGDDASPFPSGGSIDTVHQTVDEQDVGSRPESTGKVVYYPVVWMPVAGCLPQVGEVP